MFGFFRRYRLQFYILAVLVFGLNGFLNFYDYFYLRHEDATKRGMDLFGGIIMSILVIIYVGYIIDYLRHRKSLDQKSL